jgi:Xaa-Pro aminopeptidase
VSDLPGGDARPTIPVGRYAERLERVRAVARRQGVAALLVGVGADLRYLTGHAVLPLERLTLLVVPVDGLPSLVTPRLEAVGARQVPTAAAGLFEIVPWDETDDPAAIVAGRLGPTRAGGGRLLVSDRLWAMHLLALQRVLPDVRLGLATTVLRELRMAKDPTEVAALQAAAQAADRVVDRIAAGRLVGRTEADVSREVRDRLVAEGHDLADFAIVGSGPNSASPHHEASERVIQAGEPIVLDIGGTRAGYCSDTTRTLWVTGGNPANGPDPAFLALFELLHRAQAAASAAVRPGVACEAIDAVARDIITAGGHGQDFIHRVGHGIGLETHEEPDVVAGNREPLREGFAFSIEPGIYLEGRYGARIEDIVVCGAEGPIVLNASSRELRVVAG